MAYFNGRNILLAGLKGKDAITPHIGPNGNWFFGEEDSGVPATKGGSNLPIVSNSDNGKFLQVSGGVWKAVEIPYAEDVSV